MTMTKRTLAAVILAALPLATGTLRSDAIRPTGADAARSIAGQAAGPQWSYAMGEGLDGAVAVRVPDERMGLPALHAVAATTRRNGRRAHDRLDAPDSRSAVGRSTRRDVYATIVSQIA